MSVKSPHTIYPIAQTSDNLTQKCKKVIISNRNNCGSFKVINKIY